MNKLPPQFIYGIKVLKYQESDGSLRSPFMRFTYDPKYLPSVANDGTIIPGAWLPRVSRLKLCLRGYHAWYPTSSSTLMVGGSHLFLVKSSGEFIGDGSKFAATSMQFLRLIEPTQKKFQRHIAHLQTRFPLFCAIDQDCWNPRYWDWSYLSSLYIAMHYLKINPETIAKIFAHDFIDPLISRELQP